MERESQPPAAAHAARWLSGSRRGLDEPPVRRPGAEPCFQDDRRTTLPGALDVQSRSVAIDRLTWCWQVALITCGSDGLEDEGGAREHNHEDRECADDWPEPPPQAWPPRGPGRAPSGARTHRVHLHFVLDVRARAGGTASALRWTRGDQPSQSTQGGRYARSPAARARASTW